jgi:hypothetical protein
MKLVHAIKRDISLYLCKYVFRAPHPVMSPIDIVAAEGAAEIAASAHKYWEHIPVGI